MSQVLKTFGFILLLLLMAAVTWPRNIRKFAPDFKPSVWNLDLPLNQLHWVGTHDSASYKFLRTISLPGKLGGSISVNTLNYLQSWFGLAHNILGHWTFTQQYDIYDQLTMGVRALDLRVAYSKEADEFVYAHTLANEYVTEVLNQISHFLQKNPKEFIIITSKPDWENRTTMEDAVITSRYLQLVKDTFGSRLLPVTSHFPSIRESTSAGYQILFSFTPSSGPSSDTFASWVWPADRFGGNWVSTEDMEEDYKMYTSQLDRASNPQQLEQAFLYHTPSHRTIKAAYLDRLQPWSPHFGTQWKQGNGSVISNGIYTQREWMCRWLKENPFDTLARINIFWMDSPQPDVIAQIQNFQLVGWQKWQAEMCNNISF